MGDVRDSLKPYFPLQCKGTASRYEATIRTSCCAPLAQQRENVER